MYEDMRRFKESENIFVKSDKSRNLYEIEKGKYKQMMFKEVVKNYKKAPPDLEKELNNEAKMLAYRLGIVDRVEKYNTKNCFITIKALRVFWFSFDHWLCIPWFFSRGQTRLAFSFFLTPNFVLFPLVGDSRYFFLLFLVRVFFCFFLVLWILVDIRLVNIYIYIYIKERNRSKRIKKCYFK